MRTILALNVPDGGGAVWLGLLVALFLFADFREPLAKRNWALLALVALAPLLNDVGRWRMASDPRMTAAWWTVIFLLTALHTGMGIWLSRRAGPGWTPNVPRRGLAVMAGLLVLMNVAQGLAKDPEDAGTFINVGAQRWLETGKMPYGDPELTGPDAPGFGAATTYGPILYLSHIPVLLVVDHPKNPPTATVRRGQYDRPPDIITQVVAIAFHLVGLLAMFLLARRLAGPLVALGAVALYACMPYLSGLEGTTGSISGMRFISHVAPPAVLMIALATTARPFLSGAMFSIAAGTLFFPAFMFPAWLGWRLWRRDHPWRFTAGAAVAGAAILAMVIWFGHGPTAIDSVTTFLRNVIEHQEGTGYRQYGASEFGFWGTHPGLAAIFHHPLIGSNPFSQPTFLAFVALCFACAYWVRRGTLMSLAGATAAIGAGVQLWKTHGGGTYVEWYLPFLIIALVIGGRDTDSEVPQPAEDIRAA